MAITPKPKAHDPMNAPPVDVEALINKGGSVAAPTNGAGEAAKDKASLVLRIPSEVLERVDRAVQSRPVKIPRHTWILEAIIEKLENG